MIVRETPAGFLLVAQHDHGLVSGEFARRFGWTPPLREETLYAVSNHDIGWLTLDDEVLWNEEAGRPYSFMDHPPGPKMEAYEEGLDSIETESPYAALLCSAHYGSFVERSEEPHEVRFREREESRRERLRASLSGEELEGFERDFRLLRVCDDLSLFVCLNEPGHNDYPWYRDGFEFRGERFRPVWEDERTLRFEPNPLSEAFDLRIPYRVVGLDGSPVERSALKVRIACRGGPHKD